MDGFAEELRHLRSRHGLSLRDLARMVNYSHSHLGHLERGKHPSPQVAEALDVALDAGGRLVAAAQAQRLVPGDLAGVPDWDGQAAVAMMGRLRPSAEVVDGLVRMLRLHRELEDTAGARAVLGPVLAQARQVAGLRANADGDVHDQLLRLESQVAQFAGWLHQDQAAHGAAEQWFARALSQAHEVGDEDMVASILSMTSNAAWTRGDVGRAVRLGEAACRPQASHAVLALSEQQSARTYAAAGRRGDALNALGRAYDHADAAQDHPEDRPPWVYFFDPARLETQRALVLRELGDYLAAVEAFRRALAEFDPAYRRDRGQNLARLAVTYALAGERDGAEETAAEARELAEATGSPRVHAELDRVARLLGDEPAPGLDGGRDQGQE